MLTVPCAAPLLSQFEYMPQLDIQTAPWLANMSTLAGKGHSQNGQIKALPLSAMDMASIKTEVGRLVTCCLQQLVPFSPSLQRPLRRHHHLKNSLSVPSPTRCPLAWDSSAVLPICCPQRCLSGCHC